MKRFLHVLTAVAFSFCRFGHVTAAEDEYPKGEWVQLFNGKNPLL
jgi:hypothetical protein